MSNAKDYSSEAQQIPVDHHTSFGGWLPTFGQMRNALRLNFLESPSAQKSLASAETDVSATSMRQGIGLVCVTALLAGLLPVLTDAWAFNHTGMMARLLQLTDMLGNEYGLPGENAPTVLRVAIDAVQTGAGLPPAFFPKALAVDLLGIGAWLNWPVRWLNVWLVYGLSVLLLLKAQGATTTLQRFYAYTAYAALPLTLTGLGAIPVLGLLLRVGAWLWALLIYVRILEAETGLASGKIIVAVLTPVVIGLALGGIALSLVLPKI